MNFKFHNENVIAVLDFSASFVRCIVAQIKDDTDLELVSFSKKKSSGLDSGRIVDFDSVTDLIGDILNEAENIGKVSFSELWLSFNGTFYSFDSWGMASLPSREVSKKDLDLSIETACAVPIPNQHVRIHCIPQYFTVDNQDKISNPVGLSGLRLETQIRIVTIPESYCHDFNKVLKILGYKPKGFVHNLIVSSQAFTNVQQRKNGICFSYMDQKTTGLIFYREGKILDMFQISFGEESLVIALMNELQISYDEAENLKLKYGSLLCNSISEHDQVSLNDGNILVSHRTISKVLKKSINSFFEIIKQEMHDRSLTDLASSGFMFTGLFPLLEGFLDQARFCLGKPALFLNSFTESQMKGEEWEMKKANYFIHQIHLISQFEKGQKYNSFSKWNLLKDLFN